MDSPQQGWLNPYRDALETLSARPLSLFLLLLAIHCIAVPYRGFAHDSQLYALQVSNQLEPDTYGNDLFLKYGSQDQFSLFSKIVAPLAQVLGLYTAFFLVYLASKALYLYALQRLIPLLIDDRAVGVIALIVLTVSTLAFGGFQVLHVSEAFLTPRPLACALTLFGLERILNRRPIQALGLFLLGMMFHPLMAVGGVALLALVWLPGRMSGLVVVSTLLVAILLAIPALATRIFGSMDAEWLSVTRAVTPYNFPLEWTAGDWVRNLGALVIVAGASWVPSIRPELARFYRLLAILSIGGLGCTLIASELGYALLFQVQPYRVIWLVLVLQIPLGLSIVCHCWQTGRETQRLLALAILGFLCLQAFIVKELVLIAFLAPICMVLHRGLEKTARRPDWLSHSLAWSLLLGLLGWTVFRLILVFVFLPQIQYDTDGLNSVYSIMTALGVVGWLTLTLWLLKRWTTESNSLVWTSATVIVIITMTVLVVPQTSVYRRNLRPFDEDARFVAQTLQQQPTNEAPRPTIYWGLGQADVVWLEVGATNYYERQQLAGSLFQRQTAMEGQRRIDLVRPFEAERLRGRLGLMSEIERRRAETLYGSSQENNTPTLADFERLWQDPSLDFIVLPRDYGCSLESNGRWFVYDCRALRARAAAAKREKDYSPHER